MSWIWIQDHCALELAASCVMQRRDKNVSVKIIRRIIFAFMEFVDNYCYFKRTVLFFMNVATHFLIEYSTI